MSWFFGGRGGDDKGKEEVENGKPGVLKESADDAANRVFIDDPAEESIKPEKGQSPSFDPTGLERAAKAARELEGLKFAPEAIQIAKLKEDRRSKQALATAEENKARQKAFETERVHVQEQERRTTLQQDHKLKQEQSYYADQLARKRHQDQLLAERQMREQQMKREEDFQLRVESMKRQTAEYEAKLRKETERARVAAEMEGKADQERKNWDLHMQRSQMEQREFRTTIIKSVQEAGKILGTGVSSFLQDREKMITTAGLFTGIALGIYGARSATGVTARYIESRLGKPPLVRETSRATFGQVFRSPLTSIRNMTSGTKDVLSGIVVEPKLKERLGNLAVSAKNTKRNGAPFRHVMLHGPPGTGKTLFAKQLALDSGMDYAILTGGDVAPLGRDAVTEMHKLFDWASTSRKGTVIFIDEADAFLRKRSAGGLSEDLRNALNAFLYRTGTENPKFMVMFATNEPEDLDRAVNDRSDEMVPFNLPGPAERQEMLKMYFDQMIVNNVNNALSSGPFRRPQQIKIDDDVTSELLDKIAQQIEGYSGREISKLVIGWQAAAYGTVNCVLSKNLVDRVLDNSLEQHMQKKRWEEQK